MSLRPDQLLQVTPAGLYCPPADLYVDPTRAVDRAVITHGHSDHARTGHGAVLATQATIDIMRLRQGQKAVAGAQALALGEAVTVDGVTVRLVPAGHILGSAQAVLEKDGCRVVVSGDYKRRPDPTCEAFEPVASDLFVTEATFALPVFRHPPDGDEIDRLLVSTRAFADHCHVVGAYSLGKAQRVIALLRRAGYDAPVYVHAAIERMNEVYVRHGVNLGDLRPVEVATAADLAGAIVVAPPGADLPGFAEKAPDPIVAMASGWMGVRARARQRSVELPLIISDHADWDELIATIDENPGELWITHGREDALRRYLEVRDRPLRTLALEGYDDEAGA